MDIEGGEIHALRGASRTLARYRPLVVSGSWPASKGRRSSGSSTAMVTGCGTSKPADRSSPAVTRSWSSRSPPRRSTASGHMHVLRVLKTSNSLTPSLDGAPSIALPCPHKGFAPGPDFTDDWATLMNSARHGLSWSPAPTRGPPPIRRSIGLDRAGLLHSFRTALLLPGTPALGGARRGGLAPGPFAQVDGALAAASRPGDPGRAGPLGLGLSTWPSGSRAGSPARVPTPAASWRGGGPGGSTGSLARPSNATGPGRSSSSATSAREYALPACRDLGIPAVLSMVHGDVREERRGPRTRGRGLARVLPPLPRRRRARPRRTRLAPRAPARATWNWPTASSSPPTTSPRPWSATGRPARRSGRPLRGRHPPVPPRPVESATARPARSCSRAGSPSGRGSSTCSTPGGRSAGRAGGSSCSAPCPRDPGPLAAVPRRGRAPRPGRTRRGARADGGGRRVRLPVAVRGLGRRDLRGAGLRACPRRHARAPARWSATGSRGSSSRPATSTPLAAGDGAARERPRLRGAMSAAARRRAEEFDWPRYHASVVDAVARRVLARGLAGAAGGGRDDDQAYVVRDGGGHRRRCSPGRSPRSGSTRSRRSGCSSSATSRFTSSRRSPYREWAVGVRGDRARHGGELPGALGAGLVPGGLSLGPGPGWSPRRCPGRPRRGRPVGGPVVARRCSSGGWSALGLVRWAAANDRQRSRPRRRCCRRSRS